MQLDGGLRSRLLFLLQREEASADAPLICHHLVLYCCRLLPRAQFRIWIHTAYAEKHTLRDALLLLKDELDHSEMPNQVLRAVWELAGWKCRREKHYRSSAEAHGLAVDDLQILERSLNKTERGKIRTLWRQGVGPAMTSAQIQQVLARYDPICRGMVKRQLSFVWKNDRSISFQDLCSELRVEILRLARYYEVYRNTYSEERFRRCVHRGILNKRVNMAVQYSRQSRRSIARIHTAAQIRFMWYLSPKRLVIKQVVVSGHQDARRCKDEELETAVRFRSGKIKWVAVTALYETQAAARDARGSLRCRVTTERPLPYLASTDLNDFRRSSRSMDTPLDEDASLNLHNVLSSPPAISGQSFLLDLSRAGASADLQAFAKVVIGDCQDQLFAKWLYQHRKREIGVLTLPQLGKLAASWVGTNLNQIKQDLAATPSTLWNDEQRQLLFAVNGEYDETT